MTAPDPVDALRRECELLSELVAGLPEEDYARATRLPAWTVKQLLGHLYRGVDRINHGLDEPEPPAADADSVTYWRIDDAVTADDEIARRAIAVADEFDSGQALGSAWDELWRRTTARAADEDPERLVTTWRPALTLSEYLRTRVLELTVHRMDLNAALGLPPDPTEDALAITEETLLALLDPPPPGTSPVEGVAFVEIATGRREPTEDEREALGDLAGRLPVIA